MVRGLRAPLSPREESALLRVAQGNAGAHDVADEYFRRLVLLELVQEIDGKLVLTELGRERVAPKPEKWIADEVTLKRP
ncbi:hypothetical protein [Reyranella sp.]|uniref:hypothetical protein n=1 Tax=Reyranella sp. TaxID=1929291 RepID=UPI003D0BE797